MMMMDVFDITASAMTAQRLRMDTVAANLANVNTTRLADGQKTAYKRKNVMFAPLLNTPASPAEGGGGSTTMASQGVQVVKGPNGEPIFKTGISAQDEPSHKAAGVQVLAIVEDNKTPTRMVYDPNHPDANASGFVEYPNINAVTEMVDLIAASRAYEASVTAFQSGKSMNEATLEL
jgi:flagellar basal-body rod protein FlgC